MIYIASPYTSKEEEVMQDRYEVVCEFCSMMALRGYCIISPIAHWHPIAVSHNLPKSDNWWRKLDEDLLRKSDELWVLKLSRWKQSTGVRREILFARDNGIQISYFNRKGEKD